MNNPELMLYQPKVLPEFVLGELRQKLMELSIHMNVYFCIAALMSSKGIDEKKIVGLEFKNSLSEEELKRLKEVTDSIQIKVKDLQFVGYQDKVFYSHFSKIKPAFTI